MHWGHVSQVFFNLIQSLDICNWNYWFSILNCSQGDFVSLRSDSQCVRTCFTTLHLRRVSSHSLLFYFFLLSFRRSFYWFHVLFNIFDLLCCYCVFHTWTLCSWCTFAVFICYGPVGYTCICFLFLKAVEAIGNYSK